MSQMDAEDKGGLTLQVYVLPRGVKASMKD